MDTLNWSISRTAKEGSKKEANGQQWEPANSSGKKNISLKSGKVEKPWELAPEYLGLSPALLLRGR